MNERIKELAEQAGLVCESNGSIYALTNDLDCLEHFAELVAEQTHTNNKAKWYQEGYEAGQRDEREACAKLCEELRNDELIILSWADGTWDCAKAIRGRTE